MQVLFTPDFLIYFFDGILSATIAFYFYATVRHKYRGWLFLFFLFLAFESWGEAVQSFLLEHISKIRSFTEIFHLLGVGFLLQFAFRFPVKIFSSFRKISYYITLIFIVLTLVHSWGEEVGFHLPVHRYFHISLIPAIGLIVHLLTTLLLFSYQALRLARKNGESFKLSSFVLSVFRLSLYEQNYLMLAALFQVVVLHFLLALVELSMAGFGFISQFVSPAVSGMYVVIDVYTIFLILNYSRQPAGFLAKLQGLTMGGLILLTYIFLKWVFWIIDADYRLKRVREVQNFAHSAANQSVRDIFLLGENKMVYFWIYSEKNNTTIDFFTRFLDVRESDMKPLVKQRGKEIRFIHKHNIEEMKVVESGVVYQAGFDYMAYRRMLHFEVLKVGLALLGVSTFLWFLLPFIVRRSILRPLNDLVSGVKAVRSGNFEISLSVPSHDEIGFLAHEYNRMVRRLRVVNEGILKYTVNLEDVIEKRSQELKNKLAELEHTNKNLESEIESRRRLEMALIHREEFLRHIAENSPLLLFLYDFEKKQTVYLNEKALEAFLGSSDSVRTSFPLRDKVVSEDREAFENWLHSAQEGLGRGIWEHEYRIEKEGERWWILSRAVPFFQEGDGATYSQAIFISVDVTEIKRSQERASYLAYHDPLTGLPNRVMLREKFTELLEYKKDKKYAIVFIDLDRFKWINDTLGHEVGDSILIEVVSRLKKSLKSAELLVRWGGDEFVIVIEVEGDISHVTAVSEKSIAVISQPYIIQNQELYLSASIGIAIYPDHGTELNTLLRRADMAMYSAKESGKGTAIIFNDEMDQAANIFLEKTSQLRRAFEKKQLRPYYQGKHDAITGKMISMEALLRWEHPEKGLIFPGEFLKEAEESGLLIDINNQVMRQVIEQTRKWYGEGLRIPVSINISNRQFQSETMVPVLSELLREANIPPEMIELELTEEIIIDQERQAIEKLAELKEMGVLLALDDFGKGYSSLNYLRRLPISHMKIDKSFIDYINEDDKAKQLVQAIVQMAHSLDINVTAEGIERVEQRDVLVQLGVRQLQGFYYMKAVPPENIYEYL